MGTRIHLGEPMSAAQLTIGARLLGLEPEAEPPANGPEDLGWARQVLRFPIPPSAPAKACSTCRASVYWILTPRGRRMPVNPDGTSHFATCVHAAAHRRPR